MATVNIIFKFKQNGSGGGNQFLMALRESFIEKGLYRDNPADADIILFNSYQYVDDILALKKKFNEKIFVHRVDGPIKLYNHEKDKRDHITHALNNEIADATIFQSEWSREKCFEHGLSHKLYETTVLNAPNPNIFKSNKWQKFESKIQVVISSWSSNINKGFNDYLWLDKNIDFSKFDITFIGNAPCKFSNIKSIPAQTSDGIAHKLSSSHVYITSSKNDPCSNSLIESIHCGLIPIALNSGGHSEIIKRSAIGYLFDNINEVPEILNRIYNLISIGNVTQLSHRLPDMNEVSEKYLEFFDYLLINKSNIIMDRKNSYLSSVKVKYHLYKELLFRKLRII